MLITLRSLFVHRSRVETGKLWPEGNLVYYLQTRFYLNTAMPICLCIAYGCFPYMAQELNSCRIEQWPIKLEYLL